MTDQKKKSIPRIAQIRGILFKLRKRDITSLKA